MNCKSYCFDCHKEVEIKRVCSRCLEEVTDTKKSPDEIMFEKSGMVRIEYLYGRKHTIHYKNLFLLNRFNNSYVFQTNNVDYDSTREFYQRHEVSEQEYNRILKLLGWEENE